MLKEQLGKLAAFVVAVVLIILGLTVNLERIQRWVSGTQIIVTSTTRGGVTEYLAGEVLRLSLDGVQSPRVFWVFDEGQPITGNVEAQYAFPFDSQSPPGQARDRRVDAFFKLGDYYETATTLVRTRNASYTVSVGVEESGLVLKAPPSFGTEWLLTGASLTRFANGRFTQHAPLSTVPEGGQFVATRQEAEKAYGYTKNVDLKSALTTDDQAWAQYEFKNKTTAAKLTIAKPVGVPPT